MDYETVHVVVDESVALEGDVSVVVDPVWWRANIYDGPGEYEASLASFTRPQRCFHAICWYCSEVNNGGHDQFYRDHTGVVWKYALEGFRAIGLDDYSAILQKSADMLGGAPSQEHEERVGQMAKHRPDFEALDLAFYELEHSEKLSAAMSDFLRSNPASFLFDGMVRRPIFPAFEE
ncbi:MAG TPA: DMP19 family protein [Urbifossiella sp.]|nr:DMP19 family protein [Urbifossiella sp.]